ncbi:MAG: ABC transporter substrate-binding protein, partial [Chloroflexota bacterium]
SRLRPATSLVLALGLLAPLAFGGVAVAQSESDNAAEELTALTVGLGFIPSVQFAQFYLADEAGYYTDAGLEVTFQNKIDPDLITLLGQGALDIGMADGTSLIPAISQGIPVVFATTIYGRFPSIVFAPADSGITEIADLAGRRIGIPGRFGSSWIMLQALLASAGLGTDDVEVVTYPGFGQAVAVSQGQVDAATGFVNNEPVQLRSDGIEVDILRVDGVAPLPGPGLVVGTATLAEKGDALRAFTAATLRAMEEIVADPQVGLDATFQRVPELAGDPETQLAILEATVDTWLSDHALENGLGTVDRDTWQSALDIMSALPDSVVAKPLTVDQLVTDELQP